MPEFGSPFSGLANDRKLTHEELVRAIRFMVATEYTKRHSCTCSLPSQPTTSSP